MKLNQRAQCGILFVLYLLRSGRAPISSAAQGLDLSKDFLYQIANDLKVSGIIRSVRGVNGGYEVVGDPTVEQVLTCLSPVTFLTSEEKANYSKRGQEYRVLVACARTLKLALLPVLKLPLSKYSQELVSIEVKTLEEVSLTQNH